MPSLSETAVASASGAAAAIDVKRPRQEVALAPTLQRIAAECGTSLFGLVKDYAKLAFGPGRLAFDEYLALRLFDPRTYSGADKRAFVGLTRSRKIWGTANFRVENFALVENKIAADALFAAYGFRTTPTQALFCNRVATQSSRLLRSEAELTGFLRDPDRYPLFAKPLDGFQSLGSASIDRYDRASDCLITVSGQSLPLPKFVADVNANYGQGYLLQRRVSPHQAVRAICGDRLATVRLLTTMSEDGPRIIRACWKIPAGAHGADNFWRSGNLLAQLDLESGRLLRVIRGVGMSLEEVTHHPDSGAELIGAVVPNWAEVTMTALEAAKVLPDLKLIGWDIAPVDEGAVLVELNHTPDFILPQLADRRGILDAAFKRFLAECEQLSLKWSRQQRAGSKRHALDGFKVN
ncbi:MAG: sugar-transfer associated ATP-grasp domain-containing protein [Stellaceae bacterium]